MCGLTDLSFQPSGSDASEAPVSDVHRCVVQYILFPPHVATTRQERCVHDVNRHSDVTTVNVILTSFKGNVIQQICASMKYDYNYDVILIMI